MMNLLLKFVQTLPITPRTFDAFLHLAAALVVVDIITVDDWKYLARLILYRVHTKGVINGQRTQA